MKDTKSAVVVHIGMHKCASTYLQTRIFQKIPVNYVFLAGYRKEMLARLQQLDGFDSSPVIEWVNSEIENQYGDGINDVTVLSHEELSGHPHGHGDVDQYAIANNLKSCYPNAKVLVVVRDQMKYLRSIYAYRVAIKGEEYRGFHKFLGMEGEKGLFEKLEYHKLIQHYVTLFGKDQVLVIPMELLSESQENFNRRVTEFIGVPPIIMYNNKSKNESTKLYYVVQFWRPFNYIVSAIFTGAKKFKPETNEEYPYMRIRYMYYGFKRKTTGMLRRLLKTTRNLEIKDYPCYLNLVSRYSRSNNRLQELTGLKLAKYGYMLSERDKKASETDQGAGKDVLE